MYSGTTLTKYSGLVLGAHQKIDRISRRHLTRLLPDDTVFPKTRSILQFEGKNGPDGIKRKSPAKDEPWHFFNPFDDTDTGLLTLIDGHYKRLINELKAGNSERVAFEAAWLSHAIVDGLTPAHHYPYEEKLVELMGGQNIATRTSVFKKNIMPGDTHREMLKNNWEMWGTKGLLMTHWWFEIGVSTLIKPLTFSEVVPSQKDVEKIQALGLIEYFRQAAREIAVLDMYGKYYQKGWTPKLAWQVRHKLGPAIVQNVTLAWYLALVDAGIIEPKYENHRRKFGRKNLPES